MSVMTIVRGDDWEGAYVNGKLETEGHSLEVAETVRLAVRHKVAEVFVRSCDIAWLHDEGNLPDDLFKVKFEVARTQE
jgi:hypothetical protein